MPQPSQAGASPPCSSSPLLPTSASPLSSCRSSREVEGGLDLRLLHRLYLEAPDEAPKPSTASPQSHAKRRLAPQKLDAAQPVSPVPLAALPPSPPSPRTPGLQEPEAAAPEAARLRKVGSWTWIYSSPAAPPRAAAAPSAPISAAISAAPRTWASGAFQGCLGPPAKPSDDEDSADRNSAGPAGFVAGRAPTRPGQYEPPAEFVARMCGTPPFLDPLYAQPGTVHSGVACEMTDGYAFGVTVLMTLTQLATIDVVHRCRSMLMHPENRELWQAPAIPHVDAGAWPERVANELVFLVAGMTWEPRASRRMLLSVAHRRLEALAATVGVDDEEDY
jgi:hypothetical protein